MNVENLSLRFVVMRLLRHSIQLHIQHNSQEDWRNNVKNFENLIWSRISFEKHRETGPKSCFGNPKWYPNVLGITTRLKETQWFFEFSFGKYAEANRLFRFFRRGTTLHLGWNLTDHLNFSLKFRTCSWKFGSEIETVAHSFDLEV